MRLSRSNDPADDGGLPRDAGVAGSPPSLTTPQPGEDLFRYIERAAGHFDVDLYRRILGCANEWKEGDAAQGVAAPDDDSRRHARTLLARTSIADLDAHPIFEDEVSRYITTAVDAEALARLERMTLGQWKDFLLASEESEIAPLLPGLPSDVAALTVKLMTNDELVAVGAKIFNPLPGSKIGAKGYLGARIQPNSPTDDVEDIVWQVFDGWSYAVGDVVLGSNPVSSDVESVAAIERALGEVLARVRARGRDAATACWRTSTSRRRPSAATRDRPGSGSRASPESADAATTFDITVEKMRGHAATRTGRYGLYFESGQGADATNGHGKGFDMVIHEARNYGFARALRREVAAAQERAGQQGRAVGPPQRRRRLHRPRGVPQSRAARALLSRGHRDGQAPRSDHRSRRLLDAAHGGRPRRPRLVPRSHHAGEPRLPDGAADQERPHAQLPHHRVPGPRPHPRAVRLQGRRPHVGVLPGAGRDRRARAGRPRTSASRAGSISSTGGAAATRAPDTEILAEAKQAMARVRERGVELAVGHGEKLWDLEPELDRRIRHLYADSKQCIWAELPAASPRRCPNAIAVRTQSSDRTDYILHPPTGEKLDARGTDAVARLRERRAGEWNVQLVISDGLNALALTDEGHLEPFLERLRRDLDAAGFELAPEPIVVAGGRVRAGYRIGEILYGARRDATARRRPSST